MAARRARPPKTFNRQRIRTPTGNFLAGRTASGRRLVGGGRAASRADIIRRAQRNNARRGVGGPGQNVQAALRLRNLRPGQRRALGRVVARRR